MVIGNYSRGGPGLRRVVAASEVQAVADFLSIQHRWRPYPVLATHTGPRNPVIKFHGGLAAADDIRGPDDRRYPETSSGLMVSRGLA